MDNWEIEHSVSGTEFSLAVNPAGSVSIAQGQGPIVTVTASNTGHFVTASDGLPLAHHANLRPIVPQKSEERLTKDEYFTLRGHIVNALKVKKCSDFIDTLVSYNQGGMHYDSQEDIPAFAEYIYNSPDGGMFWRPAHGGQVGRKFWIGEKTRFDLNAEIYSEVLTHLLIHGVTRGSDDRLSGNLRDLGIVPIAKDGKPLPFPTGVKDGKPVNDWSGYWDTALRTACFPNLPF